MHQDTISPHNRQRLTFLGQKGSTGSQCSAQKSQCMNVKSKEKIQLLQVTSSTGKSNTRCQASRAGLEGLGVTAAPAALLCPAAHPRALHRWSSTGLSESHGPPALPFHSGSQMKPAVHGCVVHSRGLIAQEAKPTALIALPRGDESLAEPSTTL